MKNMGMKNMGMKSLKRILLAAFLIFSVMTINVGSAIIFSTGNIDNTKVAGTDYITIANTKDYYIDYWFAYPVRNIRTLQTVVDGKCSGNQMNPCGIVINYNIS